MKGKEGKMGVETPVQNLNRGFQREGKGNTTHRRSRPPNPRAQHSNARRKNIHQSAIIRKIRPRIRHIGCPNRTNRLLGRRRIPLRIIITIPRSHTQKHPGPDRRRSSRIHCRRLGRAEAQIPHTALGALARGSAVGVVGRDIVDACDDARERSRTAGVEDLDGEEAGLLGDAIVGPADGARDVRAVAVAVRVGRVGEVGEEGGAAAELLGTFC
jgi:hypothetical protein